MKTLEKHQIKAFNNNIIDIPDELCVVDYPEDGKICWRVLTKEDGDKRIVWDSHSIPEINAAKKLFDELVASGMQPFRVGVNGQRSSEIMQEFDATAEEVIFLPMKQIVGG